MTTQPNQYAINYRDKMVFHVPAHCGNQMDSLLSPLPRQFLTTISLVAKQLNPQMSRHAHHKSALSSLLPEVMRTAISFPS